MGIYKESSIIFLSLGMKIATVFNTKASGFEGVMRKGGPLIGPCLVEGEREVAVDSVLS